MKGRPIYGYFGHHKCASTWFEDIFGWIASELGLKFCVVYSEADFDGDLKKYIHDNAVEFICYANADYRQVEPIENLVGFHAVRDPRDIIVSAYFSHLKTHPTHAWPELVAYREKLQSCSKDEGLMHEIEFRRTQFEEMRTWTSSPGKNIVEVKMEDVTSHSYQMILLLAEHLGLIDSRYYGASERLRYVASKIIGRMSRKIGRATPKILSALPAERVLGIVWENDFSKKTGGRKLGDEDAGSHYRKGTHGDWINHLNESHRDAIKRNYNDLIIHYGYETNSNW